MESCKIITKPKSKKQQKIAMNDEEAADAFAEKLETTIQTNGSKSNKPRDKEQLKSHKRHKPQVNQANWKRKKTHRSKNCNS